MTAEAYGDIRVTWEGSVAITLLSNPPNNHVTLQLMRDLANAFDALDEDKRCRAIVLASEGKVFCGGADLASGNAPLEPQGGGNPLYVEATRLFDNKKPIVAAVQGAAVGAGLGLAVVADFRVAAPEARFVANFVKLGFHPGFGLTHTLPRLIGEQRAALMMLTGRRIKAEEALEWGLADEVVPVDQVRARAIALAQEIAENAPLGVTSTRATLRAGLSAAVKAQTDLEFAQQDWLRKTADYAEGIKAVNARRPGVFIGA